MPYIVTTTNSVLMIYNVTALLRPYDLYYNSTHYVSLLHLLQQLLRLHDLSCYKTKTSLGSLWSQQLLHLTIYTVTATITSLRPHILWSILFQQPSHPYVLSYHSHSYDLMTYSIPATQPPSRPIALQPYGTNATASILRLNKLMLRPIYYVLTI